MLTGKHLMADVHAYKPDDGEMAFWWLGQLGYIVKTAQATFVFDPYITPHKARLIAPLVAPEELVGVDYVLGSHDHSDHIDHAALPGIAKASPEARFVVPKMLEEALAGELGIDAERFVGLDENIVYRNAEQGVAIHAIPAAHEFLNPDPVTGLHPSLCFIVECGGLRICHTGDTCKYEGLEARLAEDGGIDAMFLPINGRDARRYREGTIGNMDFREAVDLVGAIRPRLAVPGHYDMFAGNSENPMLFADYLEAKYPERAFWIGGHGVRVKLGRE